MDKLNAREAAILFVKFLIDSVESTVRVMTARLKDGPPGRSPRVEDVELHAWFAGLGETDRANVMKVVGKTAEVGLFRACVVLDGATGGYPLPGHLSDFAVFLHSYADSSAEKADQPEWRVRINDANEEPLHDLYYRLLNEARAGKPLA